MKLIIAILAIASLSHAAEEKADLAHVVTLGTRPYYLLDKMQNGELKDKLGESFFKLKCTGSTGKSDCYIRYFMT